MCINTGRWEVEVAAAKYLKFQQRVWYQWTSWDCLWLSRCAPGLWWWTSNFRSPTYPRTSKPEAQSCYILMWQSYGCSVTPLLVSGVLEARPIWASRRKTVRCGPSWTSSWALLTDTALDHQWLERGEESSLPKFAVRDHQPKPETPAAARSGRKGGMSRPWSCHPAITRCPGLRKIFWLNRFQTQQGFRKLQMKLLTPTLIWFHSWTAQLRQNVQGHLQ